MTNSNGDHIELINGYIARFAAERDIALDPLSEDGTTTVQRGSALVSIHVIADRGVLLLLSKVMDIPDGDSCDLYRRLLTLSFLATGDTAFAINDKTNEIFLRCFRSLDGLDYTEFENLVHTIATVADEWDDKLRKEFNAGTP